MWTGQSWFYIHFTEVAQSTHGLGLQQGISSRSTQTLRGAPARRLEGQCGEAPSSTVAARGVCEAAGGVCGAAGGDRWQGQRMPGPRPAQAALAISLAMWGSAGARWGLAALACILFYIDIAKMWFFKKLSAKGRGQRLTNYLEGKKPHPAVFYLLLLEASPMTAGREREEKNQTPAAISSAWLLSWFYWFLVS